MLQWYIFGMPKERKSPQEKKSLEYTRDHFTFARHSSFPKTWKRKKTQANREYRRKSDELLVQVKPGMAAADAASIADDLTAALFQRSAVRKPLQKHGTVTVGEKVKLKLERREERIGRRSRSHEPYDRAAASTVRTLSSLEGERLAEVARRGIILCNSQDAKECFALRQSSDPVDQALYFLYRLSHGSGFEIDAMRRNQELGAVLNGWLTKANRILARDWRVIERKDAQKQKTGQKVNALRRTHL